MSEGPKIRKADLLGFLSGLSDLASGAPRRGSPEDRNQRAIQKLAKIGLRPEDLPSDSREAEELIKRRGREAKRRNPRIFDDW